MSTEYKDDPRLSAGQNALARRLAEAGNDSAEFTPEEKLALVAANMMDPKEVGLVSAEEAQDKLGLEEPKKELKLGKGLRLECWIVPLEIRAEWGYGDTKIILAPTDKIAWIEKWLEDNRNTFLIQARLHCGNGHMEFEQLFKDEVLGLCAMTKIAAEKLEQLYVGSERAKETNEQTEQSQPVG
jgi:hypothetical protein